MLKKMILLLIILLPVSLLYAQNNEIRFTNTSILDNDRLTLDEKYSFTLENNNEVFSNAVLKAGQMYSINLIGNANLIAEIYEEPIDHPNYVIETVKANVPEIFIPSIEKEYYIKISSDNKLGDTKVTLSIQKTDKYELNDKIASSFLLDESETQIKATLHSPVDFDYFKMKMDKSFEYFITFENPSDYSINFYDSQLNSIETKIKPNDTRLNFVPNETGYHYICVYSKSQSYSNETYSFKIEKEKIIKVKVAQRGGQEDVEVIVSPEKEAQEFIIDLNTQETFKSVVPLNAYIFMIGNNRYRKTSGFGKLSQCANDVKLLKSIFINCCKVPKENIFDNTDLTFSAFQKRIAEFKEQLKEKEEAQVIITYSGHGAEDGSLVFIDGGKLKPDKLKALVNELPNDTILLIDACYSGNNEGPKDLYGKEKSEQFKSNSMRVYASLAHLTAKEIQYNNIFFAHVMEFYRNVLGIEEISGNGYFTAMIGLFFAEYKFQKDENISFNDIVNYISNKGKQYVEYLAIRGRKTRSQAVEATIRLNQQPKILPINEKVSFKDVNNSFILIQKRIEPIGLLLGLSGGIGFPLGELGENYGSPAVDSFISIAYEFDFLLKGLYLNFDFGYNYLASEPVSNKRDITVNHFMPALGVKYFPLTLHEDSREWIFSFYVDLNAGLAISSIAASSFGPLKEESYTTTNFLLEGSITPCLEIFEDFNITAPIRFYFINYAESPLTMFTIGIGITYYL